MIHHIQNYTALACTPARRDALDIIEAGLAAIDTERILRESVRLEGATLFIGEHQYDLNAFQNVYVLGFGKASCAAATYLERLLGTRLVSGIAISTTPGTCTTINIREGTHPIPSLQNLEHSRAMVRMCDRITADDLVLVVVSGGGSALVCWPASECTQGVQLYEAAIRRGVPINELNVVRKHISSLKGGGLMQLLYPAAVVGLVFSDVPTKHPDMVASGPTYRDTSTIADARAIIDRYDLGDFTLNETPKDPALFTHVQNHVLVSNELALRAMHQTAERLGYTVRSAGSDLFDAPEQIIRRMTDVAAPHTAVLAAGESQFAVLKSGMSGGRNQRVALTGALTLRAGSVFASVASDGLDNGPIAGALVDPGTSERARAAGMDIRAALEQFSETPVLERTGDAIITGPTGANVSDLMLLITG